MRFNVNGVACSSDGYRVLVDRLWPRGLKEALACDDGVRR